MHVMFYTFAIVLSFSAIALASPAQQCEGLNTEGLQERIQIDPCGETKCDLQKGKNTTVVLKFKTKRLVTELTNHVNARIGGIPIPFFGVHGTSACFNVVHAKDKTPASCPLQPNKEYIYTNVFDIKSIYPELPLTVHWSLNDEIDDNVICFEIPALITRKKKH